MLKVRVIPTLLWKNVGLVKGIGFDSWRRVGTVMPSIKVYNTREVDELILLDIAATAEHRIADCDEIRNLSAECFLPLTVGGGICTLEDVKCLLRAGSDKVCINSAAFYFPDLINSTAARFGSQCIVVSIDTRKMPDGNYECFTHCGTRPTGREASHWANEMEARGAGELIVTSIERDGTMEGYDLDLLKTVTRSVKIPVIASGGAGNYQHMFEAISIGGASAVAAASIFHFTEQTPREAKKYLAQRGVPVRNTKTSLS